MVSRPSSAVSSSLRPSGSPFGHAASAAAVSSRTPLKPFVKTVWNAGTWCMSSTSGPQQSE